MSAEKFCTKCGSDGPFPTARSFLCVTCAGESQRKREVFSYRYQKARSRAVARLIREHRPRYKELLDEELERAAEAIAS